MTVNIAINGASGRMGRALIQAAAEHPDLRVTVAVEHPQASVLGQDAGTLCGLPPMGVPITADLLAAVDRFDVLIDFSRPDGALKALEVCRHHGKGMVVGTTGFTAEQLKLVEAAGEQIAMCRAANFSIGVNVCLGLLEQAAQALGPEYDVEVFEAHHRHKVDAPSGTALAMGEAVAEGRGVELDDVAVWERHGVTGERSSGAIGFSVLRAGDIVGEHVVSFAGIGERIEIAHRASSRFNFANGALRAAGWLAGRPAGQYGMRDVLESR